MESTNNDCAQIGSMSSLMCLSDDVLHMIVDHCATSFDDTHSLWENNPRGGLKVLAQVNRRLREICLDAQLCCIRMWKLESNLVDHMLEIMKSSERVKNSRSLTIRIIAPAPPNPPIPGRDTYRFSGWGLSMRTQNKSKPKPGVIPLLRSTMRTMLLSMPNLTELRLGTDDGAQTIEPWITKMFTSRRKGITLPQIKSLYVWMDHSGWDMHRAFPNLEAVSMTVLRTKQVSSLAGLPRLRVLHVRWTKEDHVRDALKLSDIRFIFGLFPNIEHVLLEGFVQPKVGLSHLAAAFEKARKLKLAITDQQLADFGDGHVDQKRSDAAFEFFKKCSTLQEICIGKQGLFEAEVIVRDAGARRGVKTLKVYRPGAGIRRVNLNTTRSYPRECRWRHGDLPECRWCHGEMDPRAFAKPDDQIDPRDLHRYYEMTLEKCRTSFFDVEWLLATKPLLASRPGGPWYR